DITPPRVSRPGESHPQPLRRTVRDALASYGSHCPDTDLGEDEPMVEQPRSLMNDADKPVAAASLATAQLLVLTPSPNYQSLIKVVEQPCHRRAIEGTVVTQP